MAEYDVANSTNPTTVQDHTIASQTTDGAGEQKEEFYDNPNFTNLYGLYLSTSKIKASIKAYATWVVGLNWTAKNSDKATLDNIQGWGEDTFQSILWNMLVIKKVNGDSYAEIIRNDNGALINLKPLDPASIRIVVNQKGTIERYEKISKDKTPNKEIPVNKMLHFCNDRVADNIHGDSVIEAVEWNIEAQEEARRMHRKKIKNSGVVGIIEVDEDNPTKLSNLKTPLKKGIEDGDYLMIPKGVMEAKGWAVTLNTQEIISWLHYLDDDFYQMIGLPKIIGGASGEIEGDSKVSYLAFEPVYKRAINELKSDIWNQLAIKIDINLPPSLQGTLADNEAKNSSQTGFQSNDTVAGVGA